MTGIVEPVASQARLDPSYGLAPAQPLLNWPDISQRIADSQTYWLSTVSGDGQPHPRPVDGVWHADRLYFSGSPRSRWYRNVLDNPQVCINLEDGVRAVILHGAVVRGGVAPAFAAQLAQRLVAKYAWGGEEIYRSVDLLIFQPASAFAWNLLYKDATRFEFPV